MKLQGLKNAYDSASYPLPEFSDEWGLLSESTYCCLGLALSPEKKITFFTIWLIIFTSNCEAIAY